MTDASYVDAIPLSVSHDPASGLWTLTAPRHSLAYYRPVAGEDRVHVLVDGRVVALDRVDGRVLWQSPHRIEGVQPEAPMSVVGERIVVPSDAIANFGSNEIGFTALDAATGERAWVRDTEPLSGYRVDGRTLVLGHRPRDAPNVLTALDLADGHRQWQHKFKFIWSMVLTDGRVIVNVSGRKHHSTRAFDARTGEELWRQEPDYYGLRLSVPAGGSTAGDHLVFAWDDNGYRGSTMRWFSSATGEPAGSFALRQSVPYDALTTDGGHTVWLWSRWGRPVYRFRPFESAKPTHSFHAHGAPLSYADLPIAPVDGWIHALDQHNRITGAEVGRWRRRSWLSPLSWPRQLPPSRRRPPEYGDLTAGPNHLYFASRHQRGGDSVLAIRHGRVLWRLPVTSEHPVPVGDRVLLTERGDRYDHLRLVDGDTGAFTGPGPGRPAVSSP